MKVFVGNKKRFATPFQCKISFLTFHSSGTVLTLCMLGPEGDLNVP